MADQAEAAAQEAPQNPESQPPEVTRDWTEIGITRFAPGQHPHSRFDDPPPTGETKPRGRDEKGRFKPTNEALPEGTDGQEGPADEAKKAEPGADGGNEKKAGAKKGSLEDLPEGARKSIQRLTKHKEVLIRQNKKAMTRLAQLETEVQRLRGDAPAAEPAAEAKPAESDDGDGYPDFDSDRYKLEDGQFNDDLYEQDVQNWKSSRSQPPSEGSQPSAEPKQEAKQESEDAERPSDPSQTAKAAQGSRPEREFTVEDMREVWVGDILVDVAETSTSLDTDEVEEMRKAMEDGKIVLSDPAAQWAAEQIDGSGADFLRLLRDNPGIVRKVYFKTRELDAGEVGAEVEKIKADVEKRRAALAAAAEPPEQKAEPEAERSKVPMSQGLNRLGQPPAVKPEPAQPDDAALDADPSIPFNEWMDRKGIQHPYEGRF